MMAFGERGPRVLAQTCPLRVSHSLSGELVAGRSGDGTKHLFRGVMAQWGPTRRSELSRYFPERA